MKVIRDLVSGGRAGEADPLYMLYLARRKEEPTYGSQQVSLFIERLQFGLSEVKRLPCGEQKLVICKGK